MAIAAYAAVVSLIHVLNQIQQHPCWRRLHPVRDQIETLLEKVSFLPDFLELHSHRFYQDLEGLARQISDVASEAEDVIDTHVVDQLISEGSGDENHMGLSSFSKEIEQVMEKVDSIKKALMVVKEGMAGQEQNPRVSVLASSSASGSSGKNTMVGFDEHLVRIMDELTGDRSDLQVISIVGMGGIGKTTLTRNVFDHSLIACHFYVRLWVTISQEYSMSGILLGLLGDMGVGQTNKKSDEDLAELGEKLHKSLWDRKYLIVMDDVWSLDIWNYIRRFFPDNKNGSRIMITTRLSDVAVSLGSRYPYFMDFLDEDQSWNLFCEKAFTEEGYPLELEVVGKNIAKSCKGLPLAIVVIGGLLSKSDMTREFWEFVAKDVASFANSGDDEHCLKILSLSYNHLPIHLKPCFLYMRVFPEDEVIKVSKLTKLWVAEGFLKPTEDKTLEEVAKEYLKDLIDRNLILRQPNQYSEKIKTCCLHDLLRDLCIRESQREHFYGVPKEQCMYMCINLNECFRCGNAFRSKGIYLPEIHDISRPPSLGSCFVCNDCRIMHPQLHRSRLVKAIDTLGAIGFLPTTKLRYLDISPLYCKFKFVPTLLPLLWNLQTLILRQVLANRIVLPSEIWDMPQLRHLVIDDGVLITPANRKGSTTILENLQTLSTVINFSCSKENLERIPNMKKLGIEYRSENNCIQGIEWSYYSLHNLVHLQRLESLFLRSNSSILKEIAFPHSLKKLSLSCCNISWEEMTIIGSLPNLEVLKLFNRAFEGSEWNPVEDDFLRLKKLLIWESDLQYWRAEKVHFPNLESLVLVSMSELENIPSEIGEIETLRLIRLVDCNESTLSSAREILEEQQSLGNEILQLDVSRSFHYLKRGMRYRLNFL